MSLLKNLSCSYVQENLDERQIVMYMPVQWDDLVLKSKNVDASLIVVKKKFTEVLTCISLCRRELEKYKITEIFLDRIWCLHLQMV